jgi:hypothetical protein
MESSHDNMLARGARMSSYTLRAMSFQEFKPPFCDPWISIHDTFSTLAGFIGPQIASVGALIPCNGEMAGHILCSTLLMNCFSFGDILWRDVRDILHDYAGNFTPSVFVNAYECASWGYIVRYYFMKNPSARFVMITIVDVNVYNFSIWEEEQIWGRSGYGCTTMLIEKTGVTSDNLINGYSKGSNIIMEFAMAIRRATQEGGDRVVSLPFFPDNVRGIMDAVLKDRIVTRNGHARWGHTFGSDPWISILEHIRTQQEGRGMMEFTACSLALNGYYSIIDIDVPLDASLVLIGETICQ